VIEGVVGFSSPAPDSPMENGASSTTATTAEVTVGENSGIVAKPHSELIKMETLPPLVVKDLTWFPHIRERIPALRERWRDLTPPARRELRQRALRDRVQWKVPARRNPARPGPARLQRRPHDRRP
jgi:hypothetical protein